MIHLLPTPKKYEILDEKYHAVALGVTTDVADWADITEGFCESFEKVFEETLPVTADAGIVLVKDGTLAANAYVIDSTEKLTARAAAREGVLYGLASVLQLVQFTDGVLTVQSLKIHDWPEKEFRAFMIDVGFCWQPFEKMLKYIDLCFMYKINHLHMHIADNVCYSLPSKAFPGLTSKKHFTYEQIAEMVDIIKGEDYLERVIFISFSFDNLVDLRRIAPGQAAQFLTGHLTDEVIDRISEHKFDLDVKHVELTAEWMEKLHSRNIIVNCWTCDTPERAAELIAMGVDQITTNILE